MQVSLVFFFVSSIALSSIESKSTLTLDTFSDYTNFRSLSLSPNGEHLLVHTKRPAWNSNSFQNSLWLYQTAERQRKLLTDQLYESVKPQWSPSGSRVAFLLKYILTQNRIDSRQIQQSIYVYSIESETTTIVRIGTDFPLAMAWAENDSALYYATMIFNTTEDPEWKDVQQYRATPTCIIRRITINNSTSSSPTDIVHLPFLIGELLYSSSKRKLFFTSVSSVLENTDMLQIYSIDLEKRSAPIKLTNDQSMKQNLQFTTDQKRIVFHIFSLSTSNTTQQRLYSLHVDTGLVERWGSDFNGNILKYTTKSNGGIYFLGQLGTNVQIYSQTSPDNTSLCHRGFDGSYQLIASSATNSIAFVFTSFSKAQEVYFIHDITQLNTTEAITSENRQYEQIELPQCQVYQWINGDDQRTIEGLLWYPPGKFQDKNLPLLVLIHGGPNDASSNHFIGSWYTWAPMAASEGWLVFEPNYRGSTGYGDQFLNEIRSRPLSRPGADILFGVDRLIEDGIVDRTKLSIGGYSYGGFLTNWLITQTTRFNAALSGAGAVEQVSYWGMTDLPVIFDDIFGGFPWVTPQTYQTESAIYQLHKIRTPTHIVSGNNDVRVPVSQSRILERGLHYLGVPVQLLLLPYEGHLLDFNPWHAKIKIREELKWLHLYGLNYTASQPSTAATYRISMSMSLFLFLIVYSYYEF
ncbi:hypothetical protein I4U23_003524 [Adineta vaga]|nr:hypothetical protein I4U23_003524 [Adineta vaga]